MFYLNIITKCVFRKWINWFFLFILPVALTLVVCLVWNVFGLIDQSVMLPNISCLPVVISSCFCVPTLIIELRKSDTMLRLQASGKTLINFYITIACYFASLQIILYFFNFALVTAILPKNDSIHDLWLHANWFEVIYSLLVLICLSLTIAFAIGIFSTNPTMSFMLGLACLVGAIIFGFFVFPVQLLATTKNYVPWYLSYFCPWHYTTALLGESWMKTTPFNLLHASIFDFNTQFISCSFKAYVGVEREMFTVLTKGDQVVDLFVPWMIVGSGLILMFVFTKHKKYRSTLN